MNPLANAQRRPLDRTRKEVMGGTEYLIYEVLCLICKDAYVRRRWGTDVGIGGEEFQLFGGFCSEACQREAFRIKFRRDWD